MSPPRLDGRLKRVAAIATIVMAVPAAALALNAFGIAIPPWATAAEHRHLAARVDQIKVDVLQAQIERRRLQLYANQARQDEYRGRGLPPPDFLLSEQADLLTRIRYLEKQLQGLVGRIIR